MRLYPHSSSALQRSGPNVFVRWLVPLITMGMHVPLLITCLNWPTETLLMTHNLISKTWDALQIVQPVYGVRGYSGRRRQWWGAVVEKVTREKQCDTLNQLCKRGSVSNSIDHYVPCDHWWLVMVLVIVLYMVMWWWWGGLYSALVSVHFFSCVVSEVFFP